MTSSLLGGWMPLCYDVLQIVVAVFFYHHVIVVVVVVIATGVSRERDELVALLNVRERHCFETLSLVGQNDDRSQYSKHCGHESDSTSCSDVTAVKVCLLPDFARVCNLSAAT